MTLIAYKHVSERSKTVHLRVHQTLFSEQMKHRLQRVGSPARWLNVEGDWSYPLTPAAVIALDRVAKDSGETIEWQDGLQEYAQAHLIQNDHEHQVRLAIEKIIREKPPLPEYTTRRMKADGTPIDPLYHQQIAYQWSQRVGGLLLAHDPGCGKTRAATDASGGWYRNQLIRPMTPAMVGGTPGVQGGVLVVCPKTVMRTWQNELAMWQSASSLVVRGDPAKKKRLAATPSHYHIVNYEGLAYVEHNSYDGLILDECFVAGTPVWTASGLRPIESIRAGDEVWSYDEVQQQVQLSRVVDTWGSFPQGALLEVVTEHGKFICTEGHPWRTARGYVAAGELRNTDTIGVAHGHRVLVRSVCEELSLAPGEEKEDLQPQLFGPIDREGQAEIPAHRFLPPVRGGFRASAAVTTGEDLRADVLRAVARKEKDGSPRVPGVRQELHAEIQIATVTDLWRCGLRAGDTSKSVSGYGAAERLVAPGGHTHGENPRPNITTAARPGCTPPSSWGQWGRPHGARACPAPGVVPLSSGMGATRGDKNRHGPLPLEDRHSEPRDAGGGRSGRRITSGRGTEADRPAEGGLVTWSRVVSVSMYQQRSGSRPEDSSTSRVSRVFNLEVAERHNYFVGEVPHLTHNCHRCANNTNQTQRALTVGERAKKRLGLSGTPISNSLESIFYPLLILDGGKALGASKTAFLEKFFHSENRGQFSKNIPNEGAAQAIAQAMAASTHFVTKEEVLPFLPKKTHSPMYLEMTGEQERYYHTVKTEAVAYIQDAEVTVEQASARMMKLLQICQGFVLSDERTGRHFNNAKTDALFDLLTDTLQGRKVIVWAYFKYEIAQIVAGLKARGIKAVHVDGDVTSQRQRDNDVDAWNRDPSVKVFVRQLGMSEGVTLIANESGTPCYDNIYCGLSYKFIEWKQSQDRIHRIGQEIPCSYTYLLTENGIDKAVYESVLQKASTAAFVHDHGKDYYLSLLRASA